MPSVVPPDWVNLSPLPLLDLAGLYEQRGETTIRDRFLLLAACRYQADGQDREADRVLQNLLRRSPHHLLQPYRTMKAALASETVCDYLEELWRSYPPQTVVDLLSSLLHRPVTLPTVKPRLQPPVDSIETRVILPDSIDLVAESQISTAAPVVQESPHSSEIYSLAEPERPDDPPPVSPSSPSRAGGQLPPVVPPTNWLGITLGIALILTGMAWVGYLFLKPLLP